MAMDGEIGAPSGSGVGIAFKRFSGACAASNIAIGEKRRGAAMVPVVRV